MGAWVVINAGWYKTVPPVRSKCVGQAAGLTRLVRLMPQSPPSPEHLRAAGNEPRRERSRQRRIPAAQLDELVLATLARAAEPLRAYQIIAALRDERKTVAPPPIYRALKRLLDQGKIERIETLSAYRLRGAEKCIHAICESCGGLSSIAAFHAVDALNAAMKHAGFASQRLSIEATGRCARCELADHGGAG